MKIGNSLVFTALTGEEGVGIRFSKLIVSNLKSVIHFVNIAKFKFRRCPNTLFEKLSLDLLYSSKLKNVKIIKDALHDPRYIDFEKAVFYIKGFNERVEIHYLIHKVTRLRIDFKFK